MNIRKAIDYSELFAATDRAVSATLPQMELYREIGRLICERPEKGAAVAVAEHLQSAYPDTNGFSPRNVRRMRDFYPVVIVNRKEHILDIQEMAVWMTLCWSLMDFAKLEMKYDQLMVGQCGARRSLEFCVERMQTRGLIASGTGRTDFAAIYDLLGGLYVVPISEHIPLRIITFLKLILVRGVSWKRACILFQHDCRNEREEQVMALSKQALLSTAELIKCAEGGIEDVSTDEKLLDALYSDANSTSDNLPDMMRGSSQQIPVTLAIANLYLRKQIILERL